MAAEEHNTGDTAEMVKTLEQAHPASESHFGHAAKGYSGPLTDAHQAQSGTVTAQSLGGFPNVMSAISDPNTPAQIQANANNVTLSNSEPAKSE